MLFCICFTTGTKLSFSKQPVSLFLMTMMIHSSESWNCAGGTISPFVVFLYAAFTYALFCGIFNNIWQDLLTIDHILVRISL